MGGVAGCLPGKHPPSYDPAGMLHFKPGKSSGWSTAHSIPPESGSAVSGPRSAPARKAPRLDGAAGLMPVTLLAAIETSMSCLDTRPVAAVVLEKT